MKIYINARQNFNSFMRMTCLALCCWGSPGHAESPAPDEPSIETPGADLANFPNSAFTLPQGRAYAEISAANYTGRSRDGAQSAQYSAGYMFRYGLLDALELRILSDGYTWVDDENQSKGMSPQAFDVKVHVMDEDEKSYLPAMGIEAYLQTNIAGADFKSGLLPALSLNFDQTLPYDIAFEYNLGFVTQLANDSSKMQFQLALSWAFQREIVNNISAFVNGYTNTAAGATTTSIGGGLQWTPAKRVTVFSNVSAGLTDSSPSIYNLTGFAVAF